jgi:Na+/proline symporter
LNIIIGLLVIIYTVSGGTKAVNYTQKYQMGIIFTGLIITFFDHYLFITRQCNI